MPAILLLLTASRRNLNLKSGLPGLAHATAANVNIRRVKKNRGCISGASLCKAEVAESLLRSVAVIDPSGQWLARWGQGMQACGVTHLRSPAFVHPAATDKEALLAYAAATGRQSELIEAQALWGGSSKWGC